VGAYKSKVMLAALTIGLVGAIWAWTTFGDRFHSVVGFVDVDKPPAASQVVFYRIAGQGTASASVTYQNQTGGSEQRDEVSLPWTYELGRMGDGRSFAYISAQNKGRSGCITAQIVVAGAVVKQSQSCGEYVIATASGRY
jgi:hypothetical protein